LALEGSAPREKDSLQSDYVMVSEENYSHLNGSQQFIKCLFRVETAQECEYTMIKQNLERALIEKEQEIEILDDQ
jgi:hypothetical protein